VLPFEMVGFPQPRRRRYGTPLMLLFFLFLSANLTLFSYIVYYPRCGKERTTVDYAESFLSGVLNWVFPRHVRQPDPSDGFSRSHALLIRGLRKVVLKSPECPRFPILASHLRAIRRCLSLSSDARDRLLWAFFLCCWQCVPYVLICVVNVIYP